MDIRDTVEWDIAEIPEAGCWLWMGPLSDTGYGRINGRVGAHVVSWEVSNGLVTEGLCVLHTCDVRCCVNPAHLFLGTHKDNTQDAKRKGRLQKGEDRPAAKLTEAAVREIVELAGQGYTTSCLARMYKVSRWPIRQILAGKGWTHVTGLSAVPQRTLPADTLLQELMQVC